MDLRQDSVTLDGLDVGYLACGDDGPLAVCLHGFPDSAWTWRHLLPELASAGFRAVAPWLRGYAPTGVPADGWYQSGALARDACLLHEAFGGDGTAVVISHDWGARAANGAAGVAPDRWRKVVTMAVPPAAAVATGLLTYSQVKRSWYIWFFQTFLADMVVPMDDLAFIDHLWEEWSPGYVDAAEDIAHVKDSLRDPANLAAAIGYYRSLFDPTKQTAELAKEEEAVGGLPPQPHLYLHGVDDGCMGAEIGAQSGAFLTVPGSHAEMIEDAGHFLHLEQPVLVNRLIVDFVTS